MYAGRSRIGRGGGLHRRENAGISSESGARNSAVESLRFPGEGSSAQGKSGPKPRPKGVGDGQHDAVTRRDSASAQTEKRVQAVKPACSEVRKSKGRAVTGTGLEKGSA